MLGIAAAIFSVLLIATGAAKVISPDDTARAIRSLGLPAHREVGRLLGFIEVVVGVGALASSQWLFAQGLLYLGFLAWISTAMAKGVPIESCGCLGSPDTPPFWGHVAIDLLAMALSFAAALTASDALLGGDVGPLLANGAVVALGAFLAWVIIGDGARLHGAVTGK